MTDRNDAECVPNPDTVFVWWERGGNLKRSWGDCQVELVDEEADSLWISEIFGI